MSSSVRALDCEDERRFETADVYARVAQRYDEQPNPLLALEERIVTPLLPASSGKRVLDVGCGTGRWLQKLAACGPAAMYGIDPSAEMLGVAEQKVGNRAILTVGIAEALPIPTASIDVLICSFVASYVADVSALACECRRVCRADATVLLTDINVETARKLGWKRELRVNGERVGLCAHSYSRENVIHCFRQADFDLELLLEPEFATEERGIFEESGKLAEFERASGNPAITVLQFTPRKQTNLSVAHKDSFSILNARIAFAAKLSLPGYVQAGGRRIESITTSQPEPTGEGLELDLSGYLLLPGLINAHDHLEFGLFPRLGNRTYVNAHEWAMDIYRPEADPIRSLRKIDKSVRLWWGGIRNLLSGVTTVCHHNEYSPVFDDSFPVRVLRNYGWAHSFAFEEEVEARLRSCSGAPFFIHLSEGTDLVAEEELWELDRRGLLNTNTVLIHALAIGERGLDLVRARGASIVWCPSSNLFLFGRTHDWKFIKACPFIALGSDSPLTARGDLLDEIRVAHKVVGVPPPNIYDLVTVKAADVLRLPDSEGSIRPRGVADLIAIRDRGLSPADAVLNATYEDVELVIIGGQIKLASERMKKRLNNCEFRHLSAIKIEDTIRWIAAPVDDLISEAEKQLGPDIRLGGKRVSRA